MYGSLISLFSSYADNFGVQFVTHKLKPIFLQVVSELEQKMEKLQAVNDDSTVAVGIYLVTILPVLENKDELESFLQKYVPSHAVFDSLTL